MFASEDPPKPSAQAHWRRRTSHPHEWFALFSSYRMRVKDLPTLSFQAYLTRSGSGKGGLEIVTGVPRVCYNFLHASEIPAGDHCAAGGGGGVLRAVQSRHRRRPDLGAARAGGRTALP